MHLRAEQAAVGKLPRGVSTTTGQELVDIGGGDATAITPVSMFASHPDWSPDSELIVFSTYGISSFQTGAPGAVNLYTVHPDGSQFTPITAYPTGATRGGCGRARRSVHRPRGHTGLQTADGIWATHPRLQP